MRMFTLGMGTLVLLLSAQCALSSDDLQAQFQNAFLGIDSQASPFVRASALVGALGDDDMDTRAMAIEALQTIPIVPASLNDNVVEALIEALADTYPNIRSTAADGLRKMGDRARLARPKLRQLLSDRDGLVRTSAARALVSLGDKSAKALEVLVNSSEHGNNRLLRLNAIAGLGEMGAKAQKALPTLIVAISDPDPTIRVEAAKAIFKIGGDASTAVRVIINELSDDETGVIAVEALGEIGPTALDAKFVLEHMARSPDKIVRTAAAIAIWKITGSHSLVMPILVDCFFDAENDVNERAAEALSEVGEPGIQFLITAIGKDDVTVKKRAATALGMAGADAADAIQCLIDLVRDEDSEAAAAAVIALARIGAASVNPLIHELYSGSAIVRMRAATALGLIGPDAVDAAPSLISLMNEQDEEAARAVVIALAGIGKPSVSLLIQALGSENAEVRARASMAIGEIGAPARDALPYLTAAFSDSNGLARSAAALASIQASGTTEGAVRTLILGLNDDSAETRLYSLRALTDIGWQNESAIKAFVTMLGDPRREIRLCAAKTLGRIGAPVVPELAIALKGSDNQLRHGAIKALRYMGRSARCALPALISALDDDNHVVRGGACLVIANIGPEAKNAVQSIKKLLKDRDRFVRNCAVKALGAIGSHEVVPELAALLAERDMSLRITVIDALGAIGADAQAALPFLVRVYNENPELRPWVVGAIEHIQPERRWPEAGDLDAPASGSQSDKRLAF